MAEQAMNVGGVELPAILYGTAWKGGETQRFVAEAIDAGFRGIDTAGQPRHYNETGVGAALREVFATGRLAREDLFIQTKFTPVIGQDRRIPYDPKAPVAEQVAQSLRSSLENLGVDRVDAYILHAPTQRNGLGEADREAWRAMEALRRAGSARLLGISNVTAEQLTELCESARVLPAFVQNRCFANLGWDAEVRGACRRFGVVYQGFSLLTANEAVLRHPDLEVIADRHGCSAAQLIFRFALAEGMIPLTGTTDRAHMEQDLAAFGIGLSSEEIRTIEQAGR